MSKNNRFYLDFNCEHALIKESAEVIGVEIDNEDIFDILSVMLVDALVGESSTIVNDVTYLVLLEYGLEKSYEHFKITIMEMVSDKLDVIRNTGIDTSRYTTIEWGTSCDCLIKYNT